MPKKLALTVLERLQLPTLLLRNGRMIEMEISKSIRERIRFTPQEIEDYELRDLANGSVSWSVAKAKLREFSFEDSEILNIQKGIDAADVAEQITPQNLDLAQKIKDIRVKSKE